MSYHTNVQTSGTILNYRGTKIYYVNYSNFHEVEQLISVIKRTREFRIVEIEQKGIKDIPFLVNITNSSIYGEGLLELIKMNNEIDEFVSKKAIYSLSPTNELIFRSINHILHKDFKLFKDHQSAIEWLISKKR